MIRDEGTTIVWYTLRCECGHAVYVEAGKAGLPVRCPFCRRRISVPPLTELRESASIESPAPPRRRAAGRFQYRLSDLLALTFWCAIFLAIGSRVERELWARLLLFLLISLLVVAPLIVGAASLLRLLRKGMCAFWDFLEEDRHDGGKKP
jgi:hypothetical protein